MKITYVSCTVQTNIDCQTLMHDHLPNILNSDLDFTPAYAAAADPILVTANKPEHWLRKIIQVNFYCKVMRVNLIDHAEESYGNLQSNLN